MLRVIAMASERAPSNLRRRAPECALRLKSRVLLALLGLVPKLGAPCARGPSSRRAAPTLWACRPASPAPGIPLGPAQLFLPSRLACPFSCTFTFASLQEAPARIRDCLEVQDQIALEDGDVGAGPPGPPASRGIGQVPSSGLYGRPDSQAGYRDGDDGGQHRRRKRGACKARWRRPRWFQNLIPA